MTIINYNDDNWQSFCSIMRRKIQLQYYRYNITIYISALRYVRQDSQFSLLLSKFLENLKTLFTNDNNSKIQKTILLLIQVSHNCCCLFLYWPTRSIYLM